jgi:G3E family GTPase
LKLLIVGGFLGAGKTTLILRLANELPGLGLGKIALVVNDFGKIGIDGQVLGATGLEVRQLYSGCICCQLGLDFLRTLQTLEQEYNPDLVVLEPSGVAEPGNILRLMPDYRGKPLEMVRSVIVADSAQLPMLLEALEPLISAQLIGADVVVLNKIDEASPGELAAAEEAVRSVVPAARLVAISAETGQNVETLYEEMLR